MFKGRLCIKGLGTSSVPCFGNQAWKESMIEILTQHCYWFCVYGKAAMKCCYHRYIYDVNAFNIRHVFFLLNVDYFQSASARRKLKKFVIFIETSDTWAELQWKLCLDSGFFKSKSNCFPVFEARNCRKCQIFGGCYQIDWHTLQL